MKLTPEIYANLTYEERKVLYDRQEQWRKFKLILLWVLIFFLVGLTLQGSELTSAQINKIADAIRRVEGSPTYGILSIQTHGDTNKARQICIRTISNNYIRWKAQTNESDYFNFLASRYCPIASDPQGNRNWRKNIHQILGRDFCSKVK